MFDKLWQITTAKLISLELLLSITVEHKLQGSGSSQENWISEEKWRNIDLL
jgi:hypothetical protein